MLIWSVVQRLDAFRWENPYSATTAPSPTTRAWAVQQVDDVTTPEVEVGCLWGSVVTEGVSETSFLHGDRAETWHQTKWFVSQKEHKVFIRTSWFVIPQQLPQADVWSTLLSGERGERGESTGGLRGGILESSFYKGWGKGYVQAAAAGVGVREDLSGRPLSPWRCCEFCKSLPTGWGSKMSHPRCSTARHLPTPGNAPPCLRSCKIRVRGEGAFTLPHECGETRALFFIPLFALFVEGSMQMHGANLCEKWDKSAILCTGVSPKSSQDIWW